MYGLLLLVLGLVCAEEFKWSEPADVDISLYSSYDVFHSRSNAVSFTSDSFVTVLANTTHLSVMYVQGNTSWFYPLMKLNDSHHMISFSVAPVSMANGTERASHLVCVLVCDGVWCLLSRVQVFLGQARALRTLVVPVSEQALTCLVSVDAVQHATAWSYSTHVGIIQKDTETQFEFPGFKNQTCLTPVLRLFLPYVFLCCRVPPHDLILFQWTVNLSNSSSSGSTRESSQTSEITLQGKWSIQNLTGNPRTTFALWDSMWCDLGIYCFLVSQDLKTNGLFGVSELRIWQGIAGTPPIAKVTFLFETTSDFGIYWGESMILLVNPEGQVSYDNLKENTFLWPNNLWINPSVWFRFQSPPSQTQCCIQDARLCWSDEVKMTCYVSQSGTSQVLDSLLLDASVQTVMTRMGADQFGRLVLLIPSANWSNLSFITSDTEMNSQSTSDTFLRVFVLFVCILVTVILLALCYVCLVICGCWVQTKSLISQFMEHNTEITQEDPL